MPSSDDEDLPLDIFQEPEGYYRSEPKPHFVEHTLTSGEHLRLRLVGSNPLWGHLIWNGAKIVSNYLESHAADLLHNKTVLELGAGAGLPSLVAVIHGATQVVVTDYPDADLVQNMQQNVDSCPFVTQQGGGKLCIAVEGYLWGSDVQPLLKHLPNPQAGFDTLILADLLFNHHCHDALVSTIVQTMKQEGNARALVFFTPYRTWLLHKDLAFFDLCREKGLVVEKVVEVVVDKVMIPDRGDELLMRTVFGYEIRWPNHLLEK